MPATDYLVSCNDSIIDVLKYMDEMKIKFVIVKDDSGKVCGTITDGDIRRGIIAGTDMTKPVSSISRGEFTYVSSTDPIEKVVEIFHNNDFNFIPVLDSERRLGNIMTRHVLNAILLMNEPMSLEYDFDKLNRTVIEHEIFVRPWGYYKTMVLNDAFQSKVIYVKPGQRLSLQSHKRREEHWTIVAGEGRVQLNDEFYHIKPGEIYHIPIGCKHRIINDSSERTLVFTEVQLGDYFGEDDIQRYEDTYGRI